MNHLEFGAIGLIGDHLMMEFFVEMGLHLVDLVDFELNGVIGTVVVFHYLMLIFLNYYSCLGTLLCFLYAVLALFNLNCKNEFLSLHDNAFC